MSIGGVVLQFSADTKRASRDIDKLVHSIKGVGRQADDTGTQMAKLGKAAKFGLAGVAAGATIGIAAIGKMLTSSVSLAANFEQSQNVLQSALGGTTADMEKLHKLALDLGTATVFSAQDASNAMIELAKAGQSAEQMMGGTVAAAMALAATEGLELSHAAKIVSNTMAQFGLKAGKAGKIADILAAGATASTASVESLAEGLKYSSGAAKGVGLSLKKTVAALALLEQAGADGSTAGVELNQMLASMVPRTQRAMGAMEELGFTAMDSSGEMKELPQIIDELSGALDGMPRPRQMELLRDIFGERGGRGINRLLGQGGDKLREYNVAVGEVGRAQEMADARTKGFKGALEKLSGAAETIGIKIGEKLLPTLTGWVESFTDWVDTPAGTAFFDTLAGQVETAILGVKSWVEEDLIPALEEVKDWFASPEGKAAIQEWAGYFRAVGDGAKWATGELGPLLDTLKDIKKITDLLPSNLLTKYLPGAIGSNFDSKGGWNKPTAGNMGRDKGVSREAPAPRGGPGSISVTVINGKQEPALDSAALALRLGRRAVA